jgi:hypothetical protein
MVVATLLLTFFVPSGAIGAGRVEASSAVRPTAASAAADAYESGAGDDTSGTAREVTSLFCY